MEMNACSECGFTSNNADEFHFHVQRHINDAKNDSINEAENDATATHTLNGMDGTNQEFLEPKKRRHTAQLNDSIQEMLESCAPALSSFVDLNQLMARLGANGLGAEFNIMKLDLGSLMMENSIHDDVLKPSSLQMATKTLAVPAQGLTSSTRPTSADSAASTSTKTKKRGPKKNLKNNNNPNEVDGTEAGTSENHLDEPEKTKGKELFCEFCTFQTTMSQHMRSHLEAHARHKGKMFQCDICKTEFSQKANMHRHRTRHSGRKPFQCNFCLKDFFRKDQMQEHKMTHIKTGTDFDCPIKDCPAFFEQHNALKQHVDREHKIPQGKSIACKRCPVTFNTTRRLILHYQTKHEKVYNGNNIAQSSRQSQADLQMAITQKPVSSNGELSSDGLLAAVSDSSTRQSASPSGALDLSAASAQPRSRKRAATRTKLTIAPMVQKFARSNSNSTSPFDCPPTGTTVAAMDSLNGCLMKNSTTNFHECSPNGLLFKNANLEPQIGALSTSSSPIPQHNFDGSALNASVNNELKILSDMLMNHSSRSSPGGDFGGQASQFNLSLFGQTLQHNHVQDQSALQIQRAQAQQASALEFNKNLLANLARQAYENLTATTAQNFTAPSSAMYGSGAPTLTTSTIELNANNIDAASTSMQHLPRSKSPNYRNLFSNSGYDLHDAAANSGELLMKLAGINEPQGMNHNGFSSASSMLQETDEKPDMTQMRLWALQATSTVGDASTMNALKVGADEDATRAGVHSATHSPSSNSDPLGELSAGKKNESFSGEKLINIGQTDDEERNNSQRRPTSAKELESNETRDQEATSVFAEMMASSSEFDQMECHDCGIVFLDSTLYLLHKGLHSASDAWRCNMCGHVCGDKYTFTTHVITSDHKSTVLSG